MLGPTAQPGGGEGGGEGGGGEEEAGGAEGGGQEGRGVVGAVRGVQEPPGGAPAVCNGCQGTLLLGGLVTYKIELYFIRL